MAIGLGVGRLDVLLEVNLCCCFDYRSRDFLLVMVQVLILVPCPSVLPNHALCIHYDRTAGACEVYLEKRHCRIKTHYSIIALTPTTRSAGDTR